MKIEIKEVIDKREKEKVSKEVLYDLPEWFGLPESTENYIIDSQDKPLLQRVRIVQIFLLWVLRRNFIEWVLVQN